MQQGAEAERSCRVSTPAGRAHAWRQAATAAALPQPLRAARAVAVESIRRCGRVQQPDKPWGHCNLIVVATERQSQCCTAVKVSVRQYSGRKCILELMHVQTGACSACAFLSSPAHGHADVSGLLLTRMLA